MTSLIWPAAQNHTEAEHRMLTWQRRPRIVYTMILCAFLPPSDARAGGCKPAPLLSAGRRTITCNYNRQSETKPFTFNEFFVKKGRLPQGGILIKQMAECSQGQTQTVLLSTVCQHFQHSEEFHLLLDRSLCASVIECECVWVRKDLFSDASQKIGGVSRE